MRVRVLVPLAVRVCGAINFWPSFEANCSVILDVAVVVVVVVVVICVSSIVKAYPSYNLSSQPGPLE